MIAGRIIMSGGLLLSMLLFAAGALFPMWATATVTPPAASPLLLGAEGPPPTPSPVTVNWEQFTALGACIVCLIWMVTKTVPDGARYAQEKLTEQTKISAEKMAEQTKHFSETVQDITTKYQTSIDKSTAVIIGLTARCAESQAIHARVLAELESKME